MSCCDRNTFTLAFMLLAVVLGSAGGHKTGEEECHFTESKTAAIQGRPMFFVRRNHGIIDSSDEEVMANSTVWRIICPSGSTVLIVVLQLNTSDGEYLQVKRTQLEGCVDRPWRNHFNKKSVLVGLLSSTNGTANSSTFQLGYVCLGRNFGDLTTKIFFNDEALQYLKDHGADAFTEAAELAIDPGRIFDAYTREHGSAILNIINKINPGKGTEPSPAPESEGQVSPAPGTGS